MASTMESTHESPMEIATPLPLTPFPLLPSHVTQPSPKAYVSSATSPERLVRQC